MIQLHIANANQEFSGAQLAAVKRAFVAARRKCSRLLLLEGVDVIAIYAPNLVIAELGIGGYTPDAHISYLYLDVRRDLDEREIFATLCHELHHASRLRGPGYGDTLLGSMVFEGLAVCFEQEATGRDTFFTDWLSKQSGVEELVERVRSHFDDTNFEHFRWFIEDESGKLPRWAGYQVGYHLVKRYLTRGAATASMLSLEPVSSFVDRAGSLHSRAA